ncbi:unnamed protein product, partial [Effrenium voratum]
QGFASATSAWQNSLSSRRNTTHCGSSFAAWQPSEKKGAEIRDGRTVERLDF